MICQELSDLKPFIVLLDKVLLLYVISFVFTDFHKIMCTTIIKMKGVSRSRLTGFTRSLSTKSQMNELPSKLLQVELQWTYKI